MGKDGTNMETGALKQAFALMGMSSSNARKVIKESEKGLGFEIFSNKKCRYDGSLVTAEAKEYAAKYKAFHEACVKSVDELYKHYFE